MSLLRRMARRARSKCVWDELALHCECVEANAQTNGKRIKERKKKDRTVVQIRRPRGKLRRKEPNNSLKNPKKNTPIRKGGMLYPSELPPPIHNSSSNPQSDRLHHLLTPWPAHLFTSVLCLWSHKSHNFPLFCSIVGLGIRCSNFMKERKMEGGGGRGLFLFVLELKSKCQYIHNYTQ